VPSPREVLEEALKDVSETDVPEDLREIAFSKTFDLHAGAVAVAPTNAHTALTGSGRPGDTVATAAPGRAPVDERDVLGRIAARLELDRATVEEVFAISGDAVELIGPSASSPAGPPRRPRRSRSWLPAAARRGAPRSGRRGTRSAACARTSASSTAGTSRRRCARWTTSSTRGSRATGSYWCGWRVPGGSASLRLSSGSAERVSSRGQ
jgi:hypothetical protein